MSDVDSDEFEEDPGINIGVSKHACFCLSFPFIKRFKSNTGHKLVRRFSTFYSFQQLPISMIMVSHFELNS